VFFSEQNININTITAPKLFGTNQIDILRLDQIDKDLSGNKWFKLKYNIENAENKGYKKVLTFGGAFSNHLVATAKACHLKQWTSIGIVRGEEVDLNNPTLSKAQAYGMTIIPISRTEYNERSSLDYLKYVSREYNAYVIPEGGSNYLGVTGCIDIWQSIHKVYDCIFLAAGTGCTASGLILGAPECTTINVVSVLKGDFMKAEVKKHLNWVLNDLSACEELLKAHQIIDTAHFGGYAKWTQDLLQFMQIFKQSTQIQLDPIYTAKSAFAMFKKLSDTSDKTVLFIHTGGLQGIKGFENRYGVNISGLN